jgi:DNA-binding response OmpR family regulator
MPKVMLVEDDENMFSLLSMFLEFEGFEVSCWNGNGDMESFLEILRREQPALLFLDVHLRKLNGFDLLHQVRSDPSMKDIRVLMASGMEFTRRCQEEGADGFILKPFEPDELVEVIRNTLG